METIELPRIQGTIDFDQLLAGLSEKNIDIAKLEQESQSKRGLEVCITEDEKQFDKIINKAKMYLLSDDLSCKVFFQEHLADNQISFSAKCNNLRIISSIRKYGVEYMLQKGAIKEKINKGFHEIYEASDLELLIGEIIDDAAKHSPKEENSEFYVQLNFDEKNPRNFSILVINKSNVMTEDIQRSEEDKKTGSGMGSGMKYYIANKLNGINYYINIVKPDTNDNSKKEIVKFGFEFVRLQ